MIRIPGWILTVAVALIGFQSQAEEKLKVRLEKASRVVEVSGLGLDISATPDTLTPVSLPRMVRAQVKVVEIKGNVPIWQISYPESGRRERIIGESLFVRGDTVRLGLEPVPQALELRSVGEKRMDVITALDIDSYLLGVLPSEMPASWPIEALKAQAVASRSYALSMMRNRRDNDFHVESTVFDQVYRLVNQTSSSLAIQEKIARAVRETSGEVLVDGKGRIIRAHYHADCGGQTELAHNVWGDQANEDFGMVQDQLCPQSPWAHWEYLVPRPNLRRWLAEYFGFSSQAALKSVAVSGRTPSGRVAELDVVFDGYPVQRIRSHEFRRLVGFANVKSTNFNLNWRGADLIVDGKGNGHGVGMCQYGARHLAERGLTYQQILQNYYPKVKLQRGAGVSTRVVKSEAPSGVL